MKVSIIYHHFPHYRYGIIKTLLESKDFEFEFWGSENVFNGIKALKNSPDLPIRALQARVTKRGFSIEGYSPILLNPSIKAIIVIGNPNILATWLLALGAKIFGKHIFFWTHGWLKDEGFIKRNVRKAYFHLSDGVLVYNQRSKAIGIRQGFPPNKIDVIYNSLDIFNINKFYEYFKTTQGGTRLHFRNPQLPLIICSARLTHSCNFTLLINAIIELRQIDFDCNIMLIGDGPARKELEILSKINGLNIIFYGECYDESIVGRFIFDADVTVSPGKVGLTAIHSLSYGTPVFSHDNFDEQMPEFEAIIPGYNGDLFQYNNHSDLAKKLIGWLKSNRSRDETRRKCRSVILDKWNPTTQAMLIEKVLKKNLRDKYGCEKR